MYSCIKVLCKTVQSHTPLTVWSLLPFHRLIYGGACVFAKGFAYLRSARSGCFFTSSKCFSLCTKYQIPNTKYQIPNTKYQIPNTKYQIPNTKYQIPNTKYQIPSKHPRRVGRALLFALLLGVLLFPSCDKEESTPDTPTTYKLTLTPPKNGTVSGNKASYKKDEITDILATAAKGFTFSHWTGVPTANKSDNPLKLKMTKAITLAAVFTKDAEQTPTYTLTLTPPKHGKVEGHKASYQKDELTDILATAADGYHFTQWTGVPDAVKTQNPLKLKMTKAITLGVVFTENKAGVSHKLTLTAPVNGTVSGHKVSYADGETTDITAKADEDYTFTGWTGVSDGNKKDNPLKIAVTQDLTLGAVFAKTYKLTLTTSENGIVSGNKPTYADGETTEITAKAADGYHFTGWTGDVPKSQQTQNPLKLVITKDVAIGATFAESDPDKLYKITLSKPAGGAVSGLGAAYKEGEVTDLTAKPNSGYAFSHWTGVSDGNKNDNPLKIAMTKDLTLAAVFVKTYDLTLTITPNAGGSVTKDPDQTTFNSGETVTLTPSPAAGYEFTGWTGAPSGKDKANPLKLTMDAAKTITATFAKKTYALNLTTPTHGTVSKNPDQAKYTHGETVTLTPSPADATYEFTGWTGAPSGKEQANPLTLTMDAAKTIAATFAKKSYTLTVNATNGSVAKSVTQAKYNHGDSVTLTATADANYGFNGWSGHNIPKGYEKANPLTIGVTSNTTINAHFQYAIYLAPNGVTLKAAGFTQGGETYTYKGETYTIVANKAALVAARDANKDMSKYITTKVTDMGELFKYKSTFNDDISAWDVSSVTDMQNMFDGASVFNQDISAWDVSQVTNMINMFTRALVFNQDIGAWDVSKVTNMSYMFNNSSAFNQNIGSWKTGKVIDMRSMFSGAFVFNQDISNWDVSQVTNMSLMFLQANKFNQDLSGWCVQQIKNKPAAFDSLTSAWNKTNRQPVWGDASKCTN